MSLYKRHSIQMTRKEVKNSRYHSVQGNVEPFKVSLGSKPRVNKMWQADIFNINPKHMIDDFHHIKKMETMLLQASI